MRTIRFTITLIAIGFIILLGAGVLAYVQQDRRVERQAEAQAAIVTFAQKKFDIEKPILKVKVGQVKVDHLGSLLKDAQHKTAEAK